jgi:hypothetical protein
MSKLLILPGLALFFILLFKALGLGASEAFLVPAFLLGYLLLGLVGLAFVIAAIHLCRRGPRQ